MKYLLKKQQSGYLKLSYQTYFSEEKGATLEVVASLTRCQSLHLELICPEGYREPRNKVGSHSQAEHVAGFEPEFFRF